MDHTTTSGIRKDISERMQKTVEKFQVDLGTVRTGRANPHILDGIVIDYYGTPTPLSQVANITVPEARSLLIAPWDASMIKEIEKAIQESDLNLPPNTDGKVVRLNFPQLTEEVRKDMVKLVRKKSEDAKVAVRNLRREANEAIKKLKLAEDVDKAEHDEIQKSTDRVCVRIDELTVSKEKDVMQI